MKKDALYRVTAEGLYEGLLAMAMFEEGEVCRLEGIAGGLHLVSVEHPYKRAELSEEALEEEWIEEIKVGDLDSPFDSDAIMRRMGKQPSAVSKPTSAVSKPTSAMEKQYGGEHYKNRAIQPIQYIMANELAFCEGCIVKYATRWRDKGGVEDLRKIIHYAEFLIENELTQ